MSELTEQVEVVKPSIEEIMKAEHDAFNNFMVMVFEPRPDRDRVKVVLDDALVRLTLQRDKFIEMLQDIIDIDDPKVRPIYVRIKLSLYKYGGFFLYDRMENTFRELVELPNFEKLTPKMLLDEARKGTPEENAHKQFTALAEMNENLKKMKSPFSQSFQRKKHSGFRFFRSGR